MELLVTVVIGIPLAIGLIALQRAMVRGGFLAVYRNRGLATSSGREARRRKKEDDRWRNEAWARAQAEVNRILDDEDR